MIIGITGNIGSGKDTVAKMIQYYFATKNIRNENNNQNIELIYSLKEFLDGIIKDKIWIYERSGWQIKKFAAKLKQMAALLLGCKEEDFESEEFKNSLLPDIFQNINDNMFEFGTQKKTKKKHTYRWLLQKLGTKCVRDLIHPNAWCNALMCDYTPIGRDKKDAEQSIQNQESFEQNEFPNWIISDLRFLNEAKAVKDRNGIIIYLDRGNKIEDEKHVSETEMYGIKYDYLITNNVTIEELYQKVVNLLEIIYV